MQAEAEVQDTAFSSLDAVAASLGTVWIDHFLPFQRSANANTVPPVFGKLPTAVHARGDVHEMAFRLLNGRALAVRCTDHFLPSQDSPKVNSVPVLLL